MKRLFFLATLLLSLTTPTLAQNFTDTIHFTVEPSSDAGATNTLECIFSSKVQNGIRVEWVFGGNREELTLGEYFNGGVSTTQPITSPGELYIYYSGSNEYDIVCNLISFGDIRVHTSGAIVTSLDVSGCTSLVALDCASLGDETKFSTLNASGCTALTDLGCIWSYLTALDVSGCTALEKLKCQQSQLTELDVSDCVALEELNCILNQLTSLDVSRCTVLTELQCQKNQLTALDVSANTNLKTLWCWNNHIPLSTLYGIYTQRANNWEDFDATEQTDTVALSACEALDLATEKTLGSAVTSFELEDEDGNVVSADAYTEDDFSFVFNDAFNGTLTLQNTSVPDASMTYYITAEECASEPLPTTRTDTLYFEFELAEGETSTAIEYGFSEAVLSGIEMEYYDGQAHPKFTPNATGSIVVHGNGHGWVYYTYEESEGYSVNCTPRYSGSANNSSGDIRLQSYAEVHFTALDAHACSAMKSLWCDGNPLNVLNVSGCLHLESLYVYQTYRLTELDVSQNPALTELQCYRNQLTTLNVSQNPALKELHCESNQLTTLDVSQNSDLTVFSCSSNQLTELDVSQNSDLTVFSCSSNQLTALDVSQNSDLTVFSCSSNQLTELDVSQNVALTSLYCDNNQLTALDVSQKTDLERLYCSENKLTTLNVKGRTALQLLDCSDNNLKILDLSDCTALQLLDCTNNRLTSLDVSACDALMMMACDDNRLTELSVNENLMALTCSNNRLPLSTLHGILEHGNLMMLDATNQSDSIVIGKNQAWDLSSEKELGETATSFELEDEEGNEVSTDDYTENDFVFQFHNPSRYTLSLQNQDLLNINYGTPADPIVFTYHVTVEERFTVSVFANNEAWGWATQTGNGSCAKDSSVTIIATPREGYRFVNWTKEGEEFSIYAVYTFAVTEDLVLVANFEEIPEEPVEEEIFTLHILANDAAWGLVSQSGNGTYKKDSLATIMALPAEGYRFVNWTQEDGAVFGLASDTTFKIVENLILVARFEKIPEVPPVEEDFTVTLTPDNSAWGMVFKTGNCIYSEGEEITILALPFAGYRFVNWTMPDGSVFGTDSLLTFKVTENLDLTANFEPIPAVKSELRLDSIPVGMVAPPLLPNNGLPGFPAEGYPFETEALIHRAVFYGDSAVLRLCAGNEVRIAMATSGGEGTLSYTWTADGGGVSVYESGFALEEWPYVTQDSVLVLFFPDSGTHLLNCHISDGAGAALDVRVYVGYHTPEPLYIEARPKTTSTRYYEDQAVYFHARPQRYAAYHWFRVRGREGSAEITDRQVTQGTLYPASFKLERPEEQHQVWVSAVDRYGCRLWDSTGVALMKMPNVMVLDDPNRPLGGVIFPEFEVEVTNTWGLCIKGFADHNGNGSSRGWDGRTPSGVKVTAGTYYYRVKIPTLDGFVYMPGAVTVIHR